MTAPPLIGLLRRMARDPLAVIDAAADLPGRIVHLPIGPRRVYLLKDPEDVHQVLVPRLASYPKSPLYRKLERAFGNGLLLSEGTLWQRQRQLMTPLFHGARLRQAGMVMLDEIGRSLGAWTAAARAAGGCTDIPALASMSRLTMAIIVRSMFGEDLPGDPAAVSDAVEVINADANRRLFALLEPPSWLPWPGRRRTDAAYALLHVTIDTLIDRPPAQGEAHEPASLLDLLRQARDPTGGGVMPRRQIRDEVMTFFLAGHETSAVSLAWLLDLICRHPDCQERLHAEVAGVVGDRPLAVADSERLPYVAMVVDEAMRLRPPVWAFSRIASQADHLGGYAIPAGTFIMVSPWLLHRSPELWQDPLAFRPERFAAEPAAAIPRHAFLPFGAGARACLGRQFALLEIRLIHARLMQRFTCRVATPPPGYQALLTLRPRPDPVISLHLRSTPGSQAAAVPLPD
jgi:cytochrome P450